MDRKLYLNNEVSEIVKITQRQVQSWTEKGLVIPFREAIGGGSKRGYDNVNLIEYLICKALLNNGQGIQSVKIILNSMREKKLLRRWYENPKVYYEELFRGEFNELIPGMNDDTQKDLRDSFFNLLVKDQSGDAWLSPVLIYFFDLTINMGRLLRKGFSIILPRVKLETSPENLKACSYLYAMLTIFPSSIIVHIGDLIGFMEKRKIELNLKED